MERHEENQASSSTVKSKEGDETTISGKTRSTLNLNATLHVCTLKKNERLYEFPESYYLTPNSTPCETLHCYIQQKT